MNDKVKFENLKRFVKKILTLTFFLALASIVPAARAADYNEKYGNYFHPKQTDQFCPVIRKLLVTQNALTGGNMRAKPLLDAWYATQLTMVTPNTLKSQQLDNAYEKELSILRNNCPDIW